MTYQSKPSEIYPDMAAVTKALGDTYRIIGFRPPSPNELHVATWRYLDKVAVWSGYYSDTYTGPAPSWPELPCGPRFIVEKIPGISVWE